MELKRITNGNTLTIMFEMQKQLLESYTQIEKLPEYPVDLDLKSSQKLLKDFIRRATEELSEAFTEVEVSAECIDKNDLKTAKVYVEKYNEEMADFNHFLLEILLFSGIDENNIEMLLEEFLDSPMPAFRSLHKTGAVLTTLLIMGNFLNQREKIKPLNQRSNTFTIFTHMERVETPEIAGGAKVNLSCLEEHAKYCWIIVHHLNKFGNLLKNKDWSQTEKTVNRLQVREALFNILLVIAQYWDFAGFTEEGLYNSYCRKNAINQQRIKEKY